MTGALEPVVHGGPDSGPAPRWDFSTNANALGPSPMARRAVAGADVVNYPDPCYRALRRAIADHRDLDPDRVVVGAGASELIHRLVSTSCAPDRARQRGAVLVLASTFGEYRFAADVAGAPVRTADDLDEFRTGLDDADVAFLCVPNNPDGRMPDGAWLAAAADHAATVGCRLVLDLAYWPLARDRPALPDDAWLLWAPNKAHGMTGIRAGWLEAPVEAPDLRRAAPSWIVSSPGVAFLESVVTEAAEDWVAQSRTVLWRWRDRLAGALESRGIVTRSSPANFLLATVGHATAVARHLRNAGVRVRDATSFGLPDAIRLSAQPPAAVDALLTALDDLLS